MHRESPFRKCGICEKEDWQDFFSVVEHEGQLIDICDPCDRERGIAFAEAGGVLTGKENYAFKQGFESVGERDEEIGTAISAMAGNLVFACIVSLLCGFAIGYYVAAREAAHIVLEGLK